MKLLWFGHACFETTSSQGTYAPNARGASRVVRLLGPKVVIPKHFKTEALSFPLDTVDNFIQDKKRVRREPHSTIELTPRELPGDQEAIPLNYI